MTQTPPPPSPIEQANIPDALLYDEADNRYNYLGSVLHGQLRVPRTNLQIEHIVEDFEAFNADRGPAFIATNTRVFIEAGCEAAVMDVLYFHLETIHSVHSWARQTLADLRKRWRKNGRSKPRNADVPQRAITEFTRLLFHRSIMVATTILECEKVTALATRGINRDKLRRLVLALKPYYAKGLPQKDRDRLRGFRSDIAGLARRPTLVANLQLIRQKAMLPGKQRLPVDALRQLRSVGALPPALEHCLPEKPATRSMGPARYKKICAVVLSFGYEPFQNKDVREAGQLTGKSAPDNVTRILSYLTEHKILILDAQTHRYQIEPSLLKKILSLQTPTD
jgi:hypothetical protein